IWEIDAPQEASALLLPRQIQEQLHYLDPVVGEAVLPVVDLLEALLPPAWPTAVLRKLLALQQFRMYPNDEYLLVVRPIEDPDLAAAGQPLCISPEVIMIKFLARGDLEAMHRDTLRIDAAHNMPNRSVLSGSVEGLEHYGHAVGVRGVKPRLIVGQQFDATRQQLLALFHGAGAALECWVEVLLQRYL